MIMILVVKQTETVLSRYLEFTRYRESKESLSVSDRVVHVSPFDDA